ncbi:putative RNA polymerase II subunit A C-terminal domain phosphatase [Blattamonas nauphoetae]|uniref:protein-serine/threonine phosphatase n=1 Tax=Blattamonas nauphoetae TaxID=2049346 RepID=A0ABQ9Y139_9EUKA|nr:putative RNA polymerase II subunit A C-terminal domain phosphatase [Blattamonas nauphoetae]
MDCTHDVVFGSLCAICGAIVQDTPSNSGTPMQRATPQSLKLFVSPTEATNQHQELQQHLERSKMLNLVFDLDHTLIHSTNDLANSQVIQRNEPNETKDVKLFTLKTLRQHCYVKPRPGYRIYLKLLTKTFNMYIFTASLQEYADEVALLLDPEQKLFTGKVYCYEDSSDHLERRGSNKPAGSMSNQSASNFGFNLASRRHLQKQLDVIFPVGDPFAIVVDDRRSVWKRNTPVLEILPFFFFYGCQDCRPPSDMIDVWKYPVPVTLSLWSHLQIPTTDEKPDETNCASPAMLRKLHRKLDEYPLIESGLTLLRVHQRFYSQPNFSSELLLPILANLQFSALRGAFIAFSGVIPLTEQKNIESYPLVASARRFGAEIVEVDSPKLTHLVYVREGTEKERKVAGLPERQMIRPKSLLPLFDPIVDGDERSIAAQTRRVLAQLEKGTERQVTVGKVFCVHLLWLIRCMDQSGWVDETPFLLTETEHPVRVEGDSPNAEDRNWEECLARFKESVRLAEAAQVEPEEQNEDSEHSERNSEDPMDSFLKNVFMNVEESSDSDSEIPSDVEATSDEEESGECQRCGESDSDRGEKRVRRVQDDSDDQD